MDLNGNERSFRFIAIHPPSPLMRGFVQVRCLRVIPSQVLRSIDSPSEV